MNYYVQYQEIIDDIKHTQTANPPSEVEKLYGNLAMLCSAIRCRDERMVR